MITVRTAYLIEDRIFVADANEQEPQVAERLAGAMKLAIRPATRRFYRGGQGSQDNPLEHSDLVMAFAEANPDLGFGEPTDRRDEYGITYWLPSQHDVVLYAATLQERAFGMPVMVSILHRFAERPGQRWNKRNLVMHDQAPLVQWVNSKMGNEVLFGLEVEYGRTEPAHRDHFKELAQLRERNCIMRCAGQIEDIRNGMACATLLEKARM